jgi:hypothetical protein
MKHNWTAFRARFRPEDPERMQAFRARVDGLQWDQAHVVNSLATLFKAVDDLAETEVAYYYRRRGTRAFISGMCRVAAWLLGSIGLLLPLLAGTAAEAFTGWGQYGYVFLAAAACCLAANTLFGGSEGHIRFVSTQLELERLITAARIDWCRYLTGPISSPEEVAQGFALISAYAQQLHETTIAETGRWGETLLAELATYRKAIDGKAQTPKKSV